MRWNPVKELKDPELRSPDIIESKHVESGEGIERLTPDDIDVSAHLIQWNPVKELKDWMKTIEVVAND